jgi:ferredoxin-NADP reductase
LQFTKIASSLFVNEAFVQGYGWTEDDLIGKSVIEIMPRTMRSSHNIGFPRFLATESSTLLGKSLPLKFLYKNGREELCEHFIIGDKINGRCRFSAIVTCHHIHRYPIKVRNLLTIIKNGDIKNTHQLKSPLLWYYWMMVHKEQNIEIVVKRVEADQPAFWSIYFSRPVNFSFDAGDWIDIEFKEKTFTGGKTYSLSSSPTESDIRITFREGISQLKKALQNVKPGDKLTVAQYGNDYDFQLKKNQSSVLIAGGVGIAPFRSMLKEMFDCEDKTDVMLIYLNQSDSFLFSDELNLWASKMPNLAITYISTKDINRKKREKLVRSLVKSTNQNFYISGPPAMVESNEHLILDMGVQVRDIRIDSFGGY